MLESARLSGRMPKQFVANTLRCLRQLDGLEHDERALFWTSSLQ
jgi:hypothetical protein